MRVLQIIPAFLPATRYGGPPESVLRLCQGLLQAGLEVELMTTDADGPGHNAAVDHDSLVDVQGVPVRYFRRYPRYEYGVSLPLVRFALRSFRHYDLVHITPLFTFTSTVTAVLARRARVPYVVSPRGMCMPWSLERRRWKKLPYWHGLERPNLNKALGLHATSQPELEQLERLFPRVPCFCVPNAVELAATAEASERIRGRVAFIGRLHPVKGFDVMIPAMSLLTRALPHSELVLAGPDHHGEWARITALAAQQDPRPRVRYLGPVAGREKAELLASAEALVLTSHTESFGNVVVEALASGTPVVAGKNCPWPELDRAGAGFWVDNTAAAVADGLARLLTSDDAPSFRARARTLARAFTVAAVGKQMAAQYERLLGERRDEAAIC